MEQPDEYHPEEQRRFIDKWSRAIYDNGRFTMIPNLLLDYAHTLDITPSELVVLINIESFRWNTRPAFPSVQRLADRTGMSERHITRLVTSLAKKGILQRKRRRNKTNAYELRPLIERLNEIALNAEADDDDGTGGQNGPIEADIIDGLNTTHVSSKTYTAKTDEVKQTNKKIPRNIIAADISVIDLDEIGF